MSRALNLLSSTALACSLSLALILVAAHVTAEGSESATTADCGNPYRDDFTQIWHCTVTVGCPDEEEPDCEPYLFYVMGFPFWSCDCTSV